MTTVTKSEKIKEWTSKEGKAVPIYKVTFSDDSTAESFGVEIPAGTPVADLLIEEGNYGKKVKMNKGFSGGGGFKKKQQPNNAAFCLSYSKDLVIADKIKFEQLLPAADKMLEWINSKTQE